MKNILAYLGGVFVCLLGLWVLCIVGLVFALKGGGEVELPNLQVKTDHAVGVVDLTGEILTSDKFEKSLRQQIDDKKIKAVVVHIDSPGGAVGASEEIYRVIKDAGLKKPVVCSMGNLAASGGLFAAAGCKKIIANESTLTGSIGVIMMSPNVKDLLSKFGVSMSIVKSGKLKDAGTPFREFLPEDKEYLQKLIDKSYELFVRVVAESRGLKIEDVKKFADGRVILGSEAKELGLIDDFGGVKEAAKAALLLAGDDAEPEIVKAVKPQGLLGYLKEMPDSEAFVWFRSLGKAQLLYQAEF